MGNQLIEKLKTKKDVAATDKFTYEEVFSETLKYFHGDELPTNVWVNKYALRDKEGNFLEKTPDDMHDRLAGEFARIDSERYNLDFEDRFKIYRNRMDRFAHIVPQGSPMSAVGNHHQIMSASNCIVVESPHDSIAGIMKAGTELAQLMKRRAGVGLDISTLRPEGFVVNNAAKTTSGCWSFADFFSYITRMIAQNARRGALMVTIGVHHPDVVQFAQMKADLSKVTGANVSIRLSDEFLKAVDENTTYQQRWPEENPIYTREVSAKEVWSVIVENATKTAEPGLIFWDRMTARLPAHSYPQFRSVSTNPCVTADTWIHTTSGPQLVSNLIDKKFKAYVDGKVYSAPKGFFLTGKKKVYKVETFGGFTLKCTKNHLLKKLTKKTRRKQYSDWTKLEDLCVGDSIFLHNQRGVSWEGEGTFNEGYILGSLLGDGTFGGYTQASETKSAYARLSFWTGTKAHMKEMATAAIKEVIPSSRADLGSGSLSSVNAIKYDRVGINSVGLKKLADKWGVYRYKKTDSSKLENSSSEFHRGFVCGYFDADGSIQGEQKKGISARIGSNNMKNLAMIQRMLARLGIISTIYRERKKAGFYPMPDGKGGYKDYWCKATHEISIANDNLFIFKELIGFRDPVKTSELNRKLGAYKRKPNREFFVDEIVKITELGEELVYDTTIDLAHYFDANGIVAHNCSEISLSPYDSCRLISLNLTGYVNQAFNSASFNWELFKNDVKIAMQMIDNLVDLELELITKIQSVCDSSEEKELWQKLYTAGQNGRRTGLGTHGLGDALAQLKIRYDSQEALDFGEKLYKILRDTSYTASIRLAEIRGAFPAFDWSLEKDNEFIKDLPKSIRGRMAKFGRRNISILTQAPTGSVSILSKCGIYNRHSVSSGVEPVFRNSYIRRKRVNQDDSDIRVDFVDKDTGDKFQNFNVYHGNILNYIEDKLGQPLGELASSETQLVLEREFKNLPDWFVTSDQIDWKFRIKLQGVEQQYIDHSISSTLNLPKGTKPELVNKIYLEGWKSGLKGVTVYVDGCRSGILVTEDDTKIDLNSRPTKIIKMQAPARLKVLECDIHHHTVRGQKWVALVGLLDGEPYELFGGYSESINIPRKYRKGKLIKRSRQKYSLHIPVGDDEDDTLVVKDVLATFNNAELAWTTRLISTTLRHGLLEYLVEQLQKDGNVNSFNKLLARVLKKYIKRDKDNAEKCQKSDCQSTNIQYQENGCPICMDCGYTKCN